MKFLFWKCYVGVALATIISAVHADEVFSYAVLKLPYASRSVTPWSAVINTQEEWQQLYESWQDDFTPPIQAPQIDFEQYQLITGGLGEKYSGGYSVVVDRVDDLGNAIYISVLEVSPGNGCVVTTGFTYPSTAILIKKSNNPLKFYITKVIQECAF